VSQLDPYIEGPVAIETEASPEQLAAVAEEFARAGFGVEVEASYARRSADLLPWVILLELRVQTKPFFDAFLTQAGADTYTAIKNFLRRMSQARKGAGTGEGEIRIRDPDKTWVILRSTLPDEAIEALRDLDWDAVRGDYLEWDYSRKVWYDPTKPNR